HPCRPWEPEGDVDWETPGRVGLYGAYNSVNYGYSYFDDRIRYQASSKVSLLAVKDPLGGTHDFKAGVEVNQTVWDQIQGYSGNTLYYDLNAIGYDPETFANFYHYEITGPIKFRTSGSTWSAFVQDAWKPVNNFTLKYGTRFDHTVMRNDLGEASVTGSMWGPRFMAAWDPFGDQRTKIAGGWGRFNDTGRLAISSYTSASGYGQKLYVGEYFKDGQGLGFLNNAAGMAVIYPIENRNIAHDKLRMPKVDEVILQLQREVIQDVAVGIDFTGKFTRNLFEPDEMNLIWDEDGSSIIGSREADPQVSQGRLRTPNLARRDYYQIDIKAVKVDSRRWAGQLVYTYTTSVGSSVGALSGSFMNDPQTQFNYGPLTTDLRHVFKGYGYWNLPTDPWDQVISFYFAYFSGRPLERLYYGEENSTYDLRIFPRGIYHRYNPVWALNVQFQQDIDVRKGDFSLYVSAENVFNNRAPASLGYAFYTENRLFAYSRQDPLQLMFGAKYSF
ncbi:MAG: TonB-dependent receptor, partial [Proteobacteria bacterium]|nr:TonB-dependent receptor [Pseudomonadota bacterium]